MISQVAIWASVKVAPLPAPRAFSILSNCWAVAYSYLGFWSSPTPYCELYLKVVLDSPNCAFLVLITITPFEPLFPYSAIAAASFKTEVDSISFGFIDLKLSLLDGKPSITYKGSELPVMVPTPLIITVDLAPGWPVEAVILTPANWPWSVFITFAFGLFSIVLLETVASDTTACFFVTVLYPCTTTSLRLTPLWSLTLIWLEVPTVALESFIPTNENIRTSPTLALIAYLPSKSVWTPFFVPLTITLTPGTGPVPSETTPETVFSWAKENCIDNANKSV